MRGPAQRCLLARRRYMCSLSLFHYSEYLVTAINNPRSLSLDSFLLNHSFEYNLAALSSWVEFTLEKILFPGRSLCPSVPPTLLPARTPMPADSSAGICCSLDLSVLKASFGPGGKASTPCALTCKAVFAM